MALLDIVKAVALKVGVTVPTAAVTSTDQNIQQIIGFVNEDGQELAARHSWQDLTNESSFMTVNVNGGILTTSSLVGGSGYAGGFSATYGIVPLTGGHGTGAQATLAVTNGVVTSCVVNINNQGANYQAGDVLTASNTNLGGTGSGFSVTVATVGAVGQEFQGNITTLAGPDFNFVVNETMWNRTQRRPVFGPKAPAEWQQLKAQFMQGPWVQYRIRGGKVLFLPVPAPGQAIYFEWVSKNWCSNATGTGQSSMLADTDVGILNERLVTLGAIWRFKETKRLAYEEDFDKAEAAIADAIGRNGGKARLNLAGQQTDIYPGVVVPAGNWNGVIG